VTIQQIKTQKSSQMKEPLNVAMVLVACNFLVTPVSAAYKNASSPIKSLHSHLNKTSIPSDILRVTVEQKALSVLVNLARRRYAKYGDINLNPVERRKIGATIDGLNRYSSNQDTRIEMWYVFARTCSDYKWIGGSHVEANQSFIVVFDVAFWECCRRIAKIPGQTAHYALKDLKKEIGDHISATRMDNLIRNQSSL